MYEASGLTCWQTFAMFITQKYKNLLTQARSSRFLYEDYRCSYIIIKILTEEFDFEITNFYNKKLLYH